MLRRVDNQPENRATRRFTDPGLPDSGTMHSGWRAIRSRITAAAVIFTSHSARALNFWSQKSFLRRLASTAAHLVRIGDLIAIPPPARPNARPRNRFPPVEITIFTIQAILTVIKPEEDEDYHLVIADPSNPSQTMIVESPNPSCAQGSLFLRMITQARQAIDQKFGGSLGERLQPNIPVTVTG